jgi:hypothetical protein
MVVMDMGINGMMSAQMANIPINMMGNWWEPMIGFSNHRIL